MVSSSKYGKLLVLCAIHGNCTLFQVFVLEKLLRKKKPSHVGRAEVKMMLLITFVVISAGVGLSVHTYYASNTSMKKDIAQFILCESSGTLDCTLDSFATDILPVLHTLHNTILALLPVMILLINWDAKNSVKIKALLIPGKNSASDR